MENTINFTKEESVKKETILKFQEYLSQDKLELNSTDTGISVDYDLTDDELKELVELEYGQTSQDVVQLFTVLCKKLVKIGIDYAKNEI